MKMGSLLILCTCSLPGIMSVFREKSVSKDMIAPLAPTLPPLGGGAHPMPRKYLYSDSLFFFAYREYLTIVTGTPQQQEKHLWRQIPVYDFPQKSC